MSLWVAFLVEIQIENENYGFNKFDLLCALTLDLNSNWVEHLLKLEITIVISKVNIPKCENPNQMLT